MRQYTCHTVNHTPVNTQLPKEREQYQSKQPAYRLLEAIFFPMVERKALIADS